MFLLLPDKTTMQIVQYCMAIAAKRCGIGLIAWTIMSNHYHVVAYDPYGRIPAFLEHLNKLVARCMNARWGRRENFWASDAVSIVELITPSDIFDAVVYTLANPVLSNLVERAADWPGSSSLGFLYNAKKKLVCPRPDHFFVEEGKMPEEETLTTVPVPRTHTAEPHDEWVARVLAAVAKIEEAQRQIRIETKSRVLGRKAVLRTAPFSAPTSPKKGDGLRPAIACNQRERRKLELALLREFRARHRDARAEFAAGNRDVEFPHGTYRHRLLGGCCAKPSRAT